jgi:hypothetical protein
MALIMAALYPSLVLKARAFSACKGWKSYMATRRTLLKGGYQTLSEHYAMLSPLLNEPLYKRPLLTEV